VNHHELTRVKIEIVLVVLVYTSLMYVVLRTFVR